MATLNELDLTAGDVKSVEITVDGAMITTADQVIRLDMIVLAEVAIAYASHIDSRYAELQAAAS